MFTAIVIFLVALLAVFALPLIIVIVLLTLAGARRRSASHGSWSDAYPPDAPTPARLIDDAYYPYGVYDQSSPHAHVPHHHQAPMHHGGYAGHTSGMGGGMHGGAHMGSGMHSGGMGGGGGVHGGH